MRLPWFTRVNRSSYSSERFYPLEWNGCDIRFKKRQHQMENKSMLNGFHENNSLLAHKVRQVGK